MKPTMADKFNALPPDARHKISALVSTLLSGLVMIFLMWVAHLAGVTYTP